MTTAIGAATRFGHLQEAADAVNQRIEAVRSGTADKVKASAGLILTRKTDGGETEILMGRLNKLDRANPKDEAGVHGSYGLFSGSVELTDAQSEIPAVFTATAREVDEESLGALSQERVLELLSLPTTKLVKNAGWKHFTAASFLTVISSEESEKVVSLFKSNLEKQPQHEITQLAWVPLKDVLQAQANKEERYNALKSQLEKDQGKALSAEELRANEELCKIHSENPALASGIQIAHYVARTIFGLKDSL